MKYIAPAFLALMLTACTGGEKPDTGTVNDGTDNDVGDADTDTDTDTDVTTGGSDSPPTSGT
jgi:hypothetical protein